MSRRATLAVCLVVLLIGPMALAGVSGTAASGTPGDGGTRSAVSVGSVDPTSTVSAGSVGTSPAVSVGSVGPTSTASVGSVDPTSTKSVGSVDPTSTKSVSDGPTGPVVGNGANGTAAPLSNGSAKISSRLRQRVAAAERGRDGAVGIAGTGGDTVAVVVESKPGAAVGVADRVGRAGGMVVARNGRLVEAAVPAAAVDGLARAEGVGFVRAPLRPSTTTVQSEGLGPINATWAHDRNVTGANVTVAVIDVEGFNLTNPEIGDQVTASRDFTGQGIGNGTTGQHGTGVAELVVDTAPDANLVPVRVNSLVQWRNAVDYIRDNTSTDVVVMSLAWFGVGPLDGTSEMNRRISRLRDDGVLWVNAAGNMGDGDHWNGTWHDPDGNGFMNFTDTDETLTLTGGSSANVWLNWNDWAIQDEDYDLYVYDDSGALLGGSGNRQDGSTAPPLEVFRDGGLPSTVHLAIKRVDATGNADFDIWFRGNYSPEYWTAERSLVNPAVGPNVTAVGAVRAGTLDIEAFSSRGPTIDGRLKPDLVAPDGVSTSTYDRTFYGTSAAAPHAGGLAALLFGVDERMGPDTVEHILQATARDVSGTAPGTTYGAGLADAIATRAAVATLNRTTVDFGAVHRSDTAIRTVTLTNLGVRPLNLTNATIEGANATAYAVTAGGSQRVLDVGQSHDLSITLDSQRRGSRNATLTLGHNGTDGETTAALTGLTVAPDVAATPATAVDFGTVPIRNGTATAGVAVENNGTAALNVTALQISGANASAFAATSTAHEPPAVLAPGETATYNLSVSVTTLGVLNATVTFEHNATDRPAVTRSLSAAAVDSYPPELTWAHTAADGTNATVLGRTGTAVISVAATDESGVDTVTVNATPLGGSTVQLSPDGGDWYNATVAVDAANATEGVHRLTVNATDQRGRAGTTETTPVTVDLTNATLAVETPAADARQNTTAVDVTATATDTVTAVSTVETRLDGGSWQPMALVNGTWNRTLSGLTEGNHTVGLRTTDAGGNTGPVRTRSVTVDTTPPSIANATLNQSHGVRPESVLSVGVDATDDRSDVAAVRAAGIPLTTGTSGWNGTLTAASALGAQSVTITVLDSVGNRATTTLSYRVGRNATLSAANGTTYEATTNDSAIDAVRIGSDTDLRNRTLTVGTATGNPTADALPSGLGLVYPQVETSVPNANVTNATIRVRVANRTLADRYVAPETVTFWAHNGNGWNRTAGRLRNQTDDTYYYAVYTDHFSAFAVAGEVEDTPPTIGSVTPADGATVSTTEPTIEALYDDGFSGVDADSVSLRVDGTDVTDGSTTSASSVSYAPTLSSGDHTATVHVADAAGNVRTRSWSFTVSVPTSSDGDDDETTSSGGESTGGDGGSAGGGESASSGGGSPSSGGGSPSSSVSDIGDTETPTASTTPTAEPTRTVTPTAASPQTALPIAEPSQRATPTAGPQSLTPAPPPRDAATATDRRPERTSPVDGGTAPPTPTSADGPGFTIVLALLSVLAAVVLARLAD